ncbi:hypothetical protein [Rhodophyticola porphyridii]|uniref:Flavodoxin family protein n=1 Tax=Rhodophyticola porphyridii TaxID=1852017 RepID=A0A3L9Y766_9RHOB|nr:hypothetical protein [Rhodophyticola porphyridii]RMA42927.1 hypothetical protein D9R08_04565 [Rhodophyticola porphyridii]
MTTRIVSYSRTGRSRALAEDLARALDGGISEITCSRYGGPLGYLRAGYDSYYSCLPEIDVAPPIGPANWLVIVAPVWVTHLATPTRRFLRAHRHLPPVAGVAVTRGGHGLLDTLREEVAAARPGFDTPLLALTGKPDEPRGRKLAEFVEAVRLVQSAPASLRVA